MGPLEQSYNIQAIGVWPNEKYRITPINPDIDPTLGFVTFENNFPFYNNIGNNFKNLVNYDFSGTNVNYNYQSYRYEIDLNSGDSFSYSPSSTRKFFDGYIFNKFFLEFDPESYQKGYVLYPTKLFLKPISISKIVNGWRFQTSAILLSATPFYFHTLDHDLTGKEINKIYYANYNGKVELPIITSSPISLSFQICASEQFNNKEILRFTDTYNPYQYNVNIEESGTRIKPDSTHIYYHHRYFSPQNQLTEIYEEPAFNLNDISYTSYILNYDPANNKTTQTFLLLQSAVNLAEPFNTLSNCVLTATLDLNTTNFKYNAATRNINPGTVVSVITGLPGTFLGLKYISDSIKLKNSKELVYNTVLAYNLDGTKSQMFSSRNSTVTNFDSVTWDLKYPPHYYNFNLLFKDSGYYNVDSQESYLTFKLSAYPVSLTTDTVILSTYIYSDFQLMKLDLPTYGVNDLIKFDIKTTLDLYVSSLCCYYGNSETPYYILDPKWIPASSANIFKITYPNLDMGEIEFSVFPILSTLAGLIEPYFSTDVVLNQGIEQSGRDGIPIFQNIVQENADFLHSSIDHLTAEDIFPTRDLRNSYISWDWYPKDEYIKLQTIFSSNGLETISAISPNQKILFSDETNNVVLSGYGPKTIILSVSSEKYNEVSSISSTSALFDLFVENSLILGSYEGLNNQYFTRNITITAAVPYKNRVYPLPDNHPLFGYWLYDNNNQTSNITARHIEGLYEASEIFSSNVLSSINISVEAPKTNLGEILHDVEYRLFSNALLIGGSYKFKIDEFPDESVLNPNFFTYYPNITNQYIHSSYNSSVLTRAMDGNNIYKLIVNDDIKNRTTNTSINWVISSNTYPLSSALNTFEIVYPALSSRETKISLNVLNTIAPGWVSGHSVSKTITIYSIPLVEFYNPLTFNIYPKFYWEGKNIVLSDTTNYTNSLSPTSFYETTNSTYSYWISANKSFNNLVFSTGNIGNSSIDLIDIPFDIGLFSDAGLPISLTAYNDKEYPIENGLFYQTSGTNGLKVHYFNNFAKTIPFNNSINNTNRFYRSPKLINYDTCNFSFTSTVTSLLVDENRHIYIDQEVLNKNIPDQIIGGTITYTLSSDFWTFSKTIEAINGTFRVFSLSIGDSYTPLNIGNSQVNNLYITASANLYKTIPSSTFINYPTYIGEKSLWKTVNFPITSSNINSIVAYTTSGKVNLYISDYYSITGKSIEIEIDNFVNGINNQILNYTINFGDNTIDSFLPEETIFHTYNSEGSYILSLTAYYTNGETRIINNVKPINILNTWEPYEQIDLRNLNESILEFPYSKEEIHIQPNEFGIVDIFNTSIDRLNQNFEYLVSNSKTINTDSPTDLYGWLGTNSFFKSKGIQWHTADYNSEYYNSPNAVSEGYSFFTNIQSINMLENYLIILDNNIIRVFENSKTPKEIFFTNYEDFIKSFHKIDYLTSNDNGDILYVSDSVNNKIHKIELDISNISFIFDILDIGGFGDLYNPNKLNNPQKIIYKNSHVYVLDYNNKCIKKYTSELTWVNTYYSNESENFNIETFDVHKDTEFIYCITSDYYLHVFDEENVEIIVLSLSDFIDKSNLLDISFDESGEFFYVVTESSTYKFTVSGIFITKVNIPQIKVINNSLNRSMLGATENYIIKYNDIVEIFGIGDGISINNWSTDDLKINSNELAQNLNYNRALNRFAKNIKNFRDSLDSKFVLLTENSNSGTVTYFAKQPINNQERPIFSDDIENVTLGVGINEYHIPQVLNREFDKIYDAINELKEFLNIKTVNSSSINGCQDVFCWSWKAMSCYNLSLPAIKICNINPITFAELETDFQVNYAPTKSWGEAHSTCCNGIISPLES